MHKDKHIRVRGERREQPDIRKLSRAVIALARAQAEKEAAADAARQRAEPKRANKPETKAS